MATYKKKSQLEKYIDDLDNLINTGWLSNEDISEFTFYHKGMTLKQFISKGRQILADVEKDLIDN